ncbi:leukocyte surface antigen CD53 [Hypomesus transpacificus]|uniref:leukocyte surface antigen CD53 n=1 Tax=Hypomesus transpacificus TaxID=137520 RepID=UPI001F07F913|nr:leukocyte surface antigen CD53 [Hypomesus transpacificus]
MAQSCLKCLKYTMCLVNFLFFMCGTAVFGFGLYMMMNSKVSSLIPSLASLNLANILFIIGIIITCVSFLGFLGALKENRCLLIAFFILLFLLMLVELAAACFMLVYEGEIDTFLQDDLQKSLRKSMKYQKSGNSTNSADDWDIIQTTLKCCGINNSTDWMDKIPDSCCSPPVTPCNTFWKEGCYTKLKVWFDENFLSVGICVIVLCVIEVLGMCFSMTLFCHISRSGLGYKL